MHKKLKEKKIQVGLCSSSVGNSSGSSSTTTSAGRSHLNLSFVCESNEREMSKVAAAYAGTSEDFQQQTGRGFTSSMIVLQIVDDDTVASACL